MHPEEHSHIKRVVVFSVRRHALKAGALQNNSMEDGSRSAPLAGLLAQAIAKCWSRETSYDPDAWCPENPAWGQCAVTALVVQDYLGGSLLSGNVEGFQHYLNRLPDEMEFDLTLHQFGAPRCISQLREADRNYVLSYPDTARRYRQLKSRVESELHAMSNHSPRPLSLSRF